MVLRSPDIKVERTTAQNLIEMRTYYSVGKSTMLIRDAVLGGTSCIVLRFGPMLAAKTHGVILDVVHIKAEGFRVHVFKLKGDNRYDTNDFSVASASGLMHNAIAVSKIDEITNLIHSGRISSGDVIAIVELPFICPDIEELLAFISLCRENAICLTVDGLGYWYNTQPVPVVQALLDHVNIAFYMQSWNTFNPEELANATMRCVRVEIEFGEMKVLDEDGEYYSSLTPKQLSTILERFLESRFAIDDLTVYRLGINKTILLPSHPTEDPLKAIGGSERYMPVTMVLLKELYDFLQIPFNPFNPEDLYRENPNVFDWNEAGLVL